MFTLRSKIEKLQPAIPDAWAVIWPTYGHADRPEKTTDAELDLEIGRLLQLMDQSPFTFEWSFRGIAAKGVPREVLFFHPDDQRMELAVPQLAYPVELIRSTPGDWPLEVQDDVLYRGAVLLVVDEQRVPHTLLDGGRPTLVARLVTALVRQTLSSSS